VPLYTNLTDEYGQTIFILQHGMQNATGFYPSDPYTVEAIYDIYSANTTVDMSTNREVTITLGFIVPEFPSLLLLQIYLAVLLLTVVVFKKKHLLSTN